MLRRWVIGHLLMTPPYLIVTPLLPTACTRKRPPQSGFVQTGIYPVENFPIRESGCKEGGYWELFETVGCKKTFSFRRNVSRRPFSRRIAMGAPASDGWRRTYRLALWMGTDTPSTC